MAHVSLISLIFLAVGGAAQAGPVATIQSLRGTNSHLLIYELDLRVVPFGNDIGKAIDWLSTISEFGFNGLWILPPFQKDKTSPYCPRSYYTLDASIFNGDSDSLVKFVSAARNGGFKVFVDIITEGQCCASSDTWNGTLLRTDARNPAGLFPDVCEWNQKFILNEVQDMVIAWTSHWINTYGFDGVRCDSASFMEWYYDYAPSYIQTFWSKIIQGIKSKTSQDVLFLAEGNQADVYSLHWPYVSAGFDYVYCSYANKVGQGDTEIKNAVTSQDFRALLGAIDVYLGEISSSFNWYAYVNTHDQNYDSTNPYNHNADQEALAVIIAMFSSPVFGTYSGTEFGSQFVPNFNSNNRYNKLVNIPDENLRCFYSRALPLFGHHMRNYTWSSYRSSTRKSSNDMVSISIEGEIQLTVSKIDAQISPEYANRYDLTLPGSSVSMVITSVHPLSFLSAACGEQPAKGTTLPSIKAPHLRGKPQ